MSELLFPLWISALVWFTCSSTFLSTFSLLLSCITSRSSQRGANTPIFTFKQLVFPLFPCFEEGFLPEDFSPFAPFTEGIGYVVRRLLPPPTPVPPPLSPSVLPSSLLERLVFNLQPEVVFSLRMCFSISSSSELLQLEERRLLPEGTGDRRRVVLLDLITPPPRCFLVRSTRGEFTGLSSRSDSRSSWIWFKDKGALFEFRNLLWWTILLSCGRDRDGKLGVISVENCKFVEVQGLFESAPTVWNFPCVLWWLPEATWSSSSIELCRISSASMAWVLIVSFNICPSLGASLPEEMRRILGDPEPELLPSSWVSKSSSWSTFNSKPGELRENTRFDMKRRIVDCFKRESCHIEVEKSTA